MPMRKWTPLLAICLGAFMLLIDVTIVNVALPRMAVDLHATFTSLQWVIDIYAITLAALLLGAGGLADRIGRRRVYVAGLFVFAASSLAAGLAPGTATLIIARGCQGVGAAAMFATTIALINASYTGRDRGIAFGIWGAGNGAAAAAGPIIGGLLTQILSWRWIFFVNLPISVAAITLSLLVLPRDRGNPGARIDVPGIVAFTICAGTLTYALTRASEIGWTATATIVLLIIAVAAAVAFVVIQLRSRNPIIEMSLLRRPAFSGVLIAALLVSVAAFSYIPFTSLWLQSVNGMSPIGAGLALAPLSVAALITALLIGRVLHSTSPRLLLGVGSAVVGVGALAQAHVSAGSTWATLTPGLVIVGIGAGLTVPTLASAALAAVPVQRGGMASGAVNTMRQLGYALGIAVLGAICQSRIAASLSGARIDGAHGVASQLISGDAASVVASAPALQRAHVNYAVHAAFASGLNAAMIVAGTTGLVSALLVVIMVRVRPDVPAHEGQPIAAAAESASPANVAV
jgi:EmrB/QacA subfamily drug resistance transporter